MESRNPTPPSQVCEQTARREFLKQVGKGVAVTAPAIALLLAASSKPASAQGPYAPDEGGDFLDLGLPGVDVGLP